MEQADAFNTKKPKLRRMASKCDHCATYNDQACISHCPTGALHFHRTDGAQGVG